MNDAPASPTRNKSSLTCNKLQSPETLKRNLQKKNSETHETKEHMDSSIGSHPASRNLESILSDKTLMREKKHNVANTDLSDVIDFKNEKARTQT